MLQECKVYSVLVTGKTLFSGGEGDVKERFGASIAGYLRKDVDALEQGTGDRLLIGAADEPKEDPDEELPEAPEAEEEAAEEVPPAAEEPDSFADEAEEDD